jgi:hypothetical protein
VKGTAIMAEREDRPADRPAFSRPRGADRERHVHLGEMHVRRETGPDVVFDCPACGTAGAGATTYNNVETVLLVFRWRTSWLCCQECGATLQSSRDVRELGGLSPEELRGVVRPYVGLVNRLFAVLAVLWGLLPIVGLVLAVVAVAINRRPDGWRTTSRVGLAIAVVAHLVFAVLLILAAVN